MRGSAAFRIGVVPGGVLAPAWVRDALWRNARAVPSLDLNFAANKSLVDATTGQNLVTFTRASSGTYVGSDGLLKTATTNLLLRSEEFDNASWSKFNATITANTTTAPNGLTTADSLIETATTTVHVAFQDAATSASSSYVYSVYLKANQRTRVQLILSDTGANLVSATFNLTTGAIVATTNGGTGSNAAAQIISVGNGWYRCILSGIPALSGATVRSHCYLLNDAGSQNYLGDGTSGIYLWGAQLEQSSTVGEYIPTTSTINSAPRFDHNPTTGESLGLLVEEQRINSIRNNTMVGAVAGTPGTQPTNWVFVAGTTGIASEIVGTGTVNGINYIDIRYSGTAATTSSFSQRFEGATTIAALTGQVWALSSWTKIQAGSTAGITAINHQYVENTSGGAFVTSGTIALTVGSDFTRHTSTRTLSGGATVAFLTGGISITVTSGQAIDITLRIGLPQLEQGAFATSVIPTSGTAATRSADVASITGANFSSWYQENTGTFYAAANSLNIDTNQRGVFGLDQNAFARGYSVSSVSATGNRLRTVRRDSVNSITVGNDVLSTLSGRAAAYLNSTETAVSVNGAAVNSNTTALTLSPMTDLRIGWQNIVGTTTNNYLCGCISRLAYWPARLANSTLQTLTQ